MLPTVTIVINEMTSDVKAVWLQLEANIASRRAK
jgi:hypothetical protein